MYSYKAKYKRVLIMVRAWSNTGSASCARVLQAHLRWSSTVKSWSPNLAEPGLFFRAKGAAIVGYIYHFFPMKPRKELYVGTVAGVDAFF